MKKLHKKIDFVWFLTELYLLLSFNLDIELIFYLEKRYFFKLPAAKKVISEKKIVTGSFKNSNCSKGLQLFSSPWKRTVSSINKFKTKITMRKSWTKNRFFPIWNQNISTFIFWSRHGTYFLPWKTRFSKITRCKKSYLRKKNVTGSFKNSNCSKGLQLFSSPWKRSVSSYQ